MRQQRKFNIWWKAIRSKDRDERVATLGRWLNYATRTASLSHDPDVQRLIYAIRDRFHKSKYKKLTRANAQKVFFLTNQHQKNYKRFAKQREALEARIRELESSRPQVQRRRITRTIHGGSGGNR